MCVDCVCVVLDTLGVEYKSPPAAPFLDGWMDGCGNRLCMQTKPSFLPSETNENERMASKM